MENIIDNNGLEEMKAQMAILKNKIEGQTMLNERLMRRAMNDRMSLVRRMVVLDVVMVIVCIAAMYAFMELFGLSLLFFVVSVVLFSWCLVSSAYINRIKESELLEGDLLKTGEKLVRMKRQRVRLMMINLPLGLAWAAWYGYEMISLETARGGSPRSMIVGLCVGFVVGIILGLMMLRKMQQANDIVIRQIKKMKDL